MAGANAGSRNAARLNDIWLLNNALKFWTACPTARCRRAKSCVGDPAACHAIFWPVVPQELKVWWGTLAAARREDLSFRQAKRHADAAAAAFRKREALLARLKRSGRAG